MLFSESGRDRIKGKHINPERDTRPSKALPALLGKRFLFARRSMLKHTAAPTAGIA
jgi:hypothetical protein